MRQMKRPASAFQHTTPRIHTTVYQVYTPCGAVACSFYILHPAGVVRLYSPIAALPPPPPIVSTSNALAQNNSAPFHSSPGAEEYLRTGLKKTYGSLQYFYKPNKHHIIKKKTHTREWWDTTVVTPLHKHGTPSPLAFPKTTLTPIQIL